MNRELDLSARTHELVLAALTALKTEAGIQGAIIQDGGGQYPDYCDGSVTLDVGGKQYRYYVVCKFLIDRKITIARVREQLSRIPSKVLLIAPHISKELAQYCRSIELEFIDGAGNAYLNAEGLHVRIDGLNHEISNQKISTKRGTNNPSFMKLVFALLAKPDLLNMPYRQMAMEANVPLGIIGPVLTALTKQGHLLTRSSSSGKKTRVLTHTRQLLDRWVLNYQGTLLPKLNARCFSCADPHWWQTARLNEFPAWWGGEVAAQKMTQYLKPVTQTLYIDKDNMSQVLKRLAKEYRIKSDPTGTIELREKFWNFPNQREPIDVAPAILIYTDLMTSLDPRNIEVAGQIEKHWIQNALDTA
ncbi:hypothetical protein AAKU67_000444 [Oxalobacteraceae bacterium GrIS 2.11]